MPTFNVHFLPNQVEPSQLSGSVAVVIDLLRASTTICQALASGATCVVPFLEIDDARRAAEAFARREIVLGGERHGKLIEGFDLGNSPLEYTPEAVRNRRVLFTTTNGTRALHHAEAAERTLVGCALNRQAVADAVAEAPRVDILCAGTDGEITGEDILAAGALAEALLECGCDRRAVDWKLNERARSAWQQWRGVVSAAAQSGSGLPRVLAEHLRSTAGGRNLIEIGHDADLAACAELDTLIVVPELDRVSGEIRPA